MRTAEVIWHCGNPNCNNCNRRAHRILVAQERFERRRAAVESFVIVLGAFFIAYIMLWG